MPVGSEAHRATVVEGRLLTSPTTLHHTVKCSRSAPTHRPLPEAATARDRADTSAAGLPRTNGAPSAQWGERGAPPRWGRRVGAPGAACRAPELVVMGLPSEHLHEKSTCHVATAQACDDLHVSDPMSQRFAEAQRRLVSQASDFSLETIAAMVDNEAIDPSPDYQRRQRWDLATQSALIESFLLNVPVPPVYLSEEDFGVYSVIDGKQRITAIHDFMRNRFALRGLRELEALNGMRISDLDDSMANALRMRPYIRAVTLLKQSDPELKYEVFIRLNRGGESLTAQEIRNVAFRGDLNDLVIRLSDNSFLHEQFNITRQSERYRQMQDAEIVLRFLTLDWVGEAYKGDLSATMDGYMLIHRHVDEAFLLQMESRFEKSLEWCYRIWGEYAFRRAEYGSWRGRALLGMYDAEMLAVSNLDDTQLQHAESHKNVVIGETSRMFEDEDFLKAVTVSTNTSARLRHRVDRVMDLLRSL